MIDERLCLQRQHNLQGIEILYLGDQDTLHVTTLPNKVPMNASSAGESSLKLSVSPVSRTRHTSMRCDGKLGTNDKEQGTE